MSAIAGLLAAPGLPPELLACKSFHHAYRLTADLEHVLGPALQSPSGVDFQRWAHQHPQPERALRRVVAAAAAVQAGKLSIDEAHRQLVAFCPPKHRLVSMETVRELPDVETFAPPTDVVRTGEGNLATEVLNDALHAFASATGYAPTPSAAAALRMRWDIVSSAVASPDQPPHPIALVDDSEQRSSSCRTARRARHHLAITPRLSARQIAAADRFLLGSTGGSPSWLAVWGTGRGDLLLGRWGATWATDLLRCDAAHDRLADTERAIAARRIRRAVRSRSEPATLPSPTPTTYLGLTLAS